jgi:LmbE family N-acetylglucosaminyl deacetylase
VNVLVVASHPDDECLGCGGVIAKHVTAGDMVGFKFLSDGEGSRQYFFSSGKPDPLRRIKAMQKAAEVLGVTQWHHRVDFLDNRFDSVALLGIVRQIEDAILLFKPDIIYTHSPADLNIDHRRTFEATMTACRPGHTSVKEIYSYEVPSSTEWGFTPFRPTMFVDITEHEETKLRALQCYESELRDYPHPRSIEAIKARHRYWGSVSGLGCAEAFEVVRLVR